MYGTILFESEMCIKSLKKSFLNDIFETYFKDF